MDEIAEWLYQLTPLIVELGANNSALEVRVFREQTFDHRLPPLFFAKADDPKSALIRLEKEFGAGVYWVIVVVDRLVRRRFAVVVGQQ